MFPGGITMARYLRIAALVLAGVTTTQSQPGPSNGDEVCACQPGFYQFTLDFVQTCQDTTVVKSSGVADTACILTPIGENENVTDLVPAVVSAISVLELNQLSEVVKQTTLTDQNLLSGGVFNYTSIIQSDPSGLNQTSLPKGIQVFLTAENSAGDDLVSFYAIEFTNDCNVAPVLSVGQKIGWTFFVRWNVICLGNNLCCSLIPKFSSILLHCTFLQNTEPAG